MRQEIPRYAPLHGGSFTAPPVPESPDPLVAYRWANPQSSDPFQVYELLPKAVSTDTPASFGNLKSLTRKTADVTVQGTGRVQLDFGVESAAWIEFDSPDCPGDIEVSISEYNEPGIDKTGIAVRHGSTFRLELNPELYDGVRFAWIRVKTFSKPWHITAVRAVCQVKPTNYRGSFSCSDPELTKSWYMAAYGVKVSLCADYFGSILMDRGDRISWTGDAHPTQAAALVAFANYDFIRRNIDNTATKDNGIRSYALYWVLSLLDYYYYSGDVALLTKYLDTVRAKLDAAYAAFDKDPPLRFYGWDERLGAGFEIWFRPCAEAQHAYRMLSLRVWREFARAMEGIGRRELRDQYADYARVKLASLTKASGWHAPFGIHAAADAINTGLLDAPTDEALYTREFSDRVSRLSLSPFNQYFILQAMARLGKWDEALCTVRDMWGGMLRYGGTTPIEVYRPSWNAVIGRNDAVPNTQCGIVSLCHPWGAGIVKWLSEQVLGITPTSPGFATYAVLPHLGTTLTHVSGATPTPHGELSARFDLVTGKGQLIAPPGTLGQLGVPKAGRKITRITINGKPAWDGRFQPLPGIASAREDAEFVLFEGVGPGTYSVRTSYIGRPLKPALVAKEVYPGRLVKTDIVTRGSWGGVYGRDGYVLCGQEPKGMDKQVLPSYVRSLDFFRAFPKAGRPDTTVWATSTTNPSALAPDPRNGEMRRATCLSNNDQTMTVTIGIEGTRKFQVALYFIDWENHGRRAAVEMFDAASLRLIAPVSVVRGHAKGIYLVFEYDRSVKFRFDKIRGDLVTLSGLFFDSSGK